MNVHKICLLSFTVNFIQKEQGGHQVIEKGLKCVINDINLQYSVNENKYPSEIKNSFAMDFIHFDSHLLT